MIFCGVCVELILNNYFYIRETGERFRGGMEWNKMTTKQQKETKYTHISPFRSLA
jgi:hypothetical protein